MLPGAWACARLPVGRESDVDMPNEVRSAHQRRAEDHPYLGLDPTPDASLGKSVDSQTHLDLETNDLRSQRTRFRDAALLSRCTAANLNYTPLR